MDSAGRRLYVSHCHRRGSGRSRCRQGGRTDHPASRRPRHRHRARSEQGLHQQRPIQQRDGLRPEDAGQDRRTRRRQESRLPSATSRRPSASSPFNGGSSDATRHRRQDQRDREDLSAGRQAGILPSPTAPARSTSNLEETSEIVEIDAAKPAVTRRASLAPCDGPSGLAIDVKNKKLFSVCGNKMMAVTDIATCKVIATPAIGSGPDAAGFDPGSASPSVPMAATAH